MKKLLFLLTLSAFALLSLLTSPPPFQGGGRGVVAAPRDCYTFTLDNVTADSLGDVTISGASGQADFNVTGYGQYQQQLCFTALSATIEGTVVPYPNIVKIQLTNGITVQAGWQSPSLVEVTNISKQNRPVQ